MTCALGLPKSSLKAFLALGLYRLSATPPSFENVNSSALNEAFGSNLANRGLSTARSTASRGLPCLEDEGGGSCLQSKLGARLVRFRLPAVQASSKPRMRSVLHPVCVVIPTR